MVEQVCKVVWVPGRRVEAGHVRVVRATLPAARIAAVERGLHAGLVGTRF
jgi:hypothetical protein